MTPHKILLRIVSTIFGKEWFTRPRWGCWLLTCMDPIKEPPCWFADPSHKLGLKLFGLVETPRWLRETCSIKTLQWQLGGIRGCKRNWEALINFHAVGGGGWAHCGSICYTQWPRFAQMPQPNAFSQQRQNIENATLVFFLTFLPHSPPIRLLLKGPFWEKVYK